MSRTRRRGLSLIELLVVLAVMAILLAVAAPRFGRAAEQARADTAAANLRAVWAAQRLYWLENRTYAPSLAALGDLLDPSLLAAGGFYGYAVESAGPATLRVGATRAGGGQYSGKLVLDETGAVTGVIVSAGQPSIKPGML